MQTITTVALLAIVGLYFIGPVFWAIATNPPSDEAAIRARYEGLQGAVGPNAKVVSVNRSGIWWRGRYGPVFRRYEVVIERHNGSQMVKMVGVPVGILSSGEAEELA